MLPRPCHYSFQSPYVDLPFCTTFHQDQVNSVPSLTDFYNKLLFNLPQIPFDPSLYPLDAPCQALLLIVETFLHTLYIFRSLLGISEIKIETDIVSFFPCLAVPHFLLYGPSFRTSYRQQTLYCSFPEVNLDTLLFFLLK